MKLQELICSAHTFSFNKNKGIVEFNINIPESRGVYFLILKDEIVYIGKASNIRQRIATHIKGIKIFNKVAWHICDNNSEIEYTCIKLVKPVYNAEANPDRASDKEIPIERITKELIIKHNVTRKDIEERYTGTVSYELFKFILSIK